MDAREAIEETINRLFAAWNSNDARAFIALFTREARYTGTDGVVRHGRVHIEAMVRELVPVVRVAIEGSISVDVQGFRGEATFHWVSAGEGKGILNQLSDLIVAKRGGIDREIRRFSVEGLSF